MRVQLVILYLLAWTSAAGDTLTLRDGTVVEGRFFGGTSQEIRFVVGKDVRFIPLADIALISLGPAPPAAAEPECPPCAAESPPKAPAPPTTKASAEPAEVVPGDIPAGTPLIVRMIDEVDSTRHRVGQSFVAALDEPVVVRKETRVPKGADALVRLLLNTVSDDPDIPPVYGLELISITIDEQQLDIRTSQAGLASSRDRKRTIMGGLASAGAKVGRVFGGSRGGQVGGAAGDVVGDVALGGSEVRVPADTRLRFTLAGAISRGTKTVTESDESGDPTLRALPAPSDT